MSGLRLGGRVFAMSGALPATVAIEGARIAYHSYKVNEAWRGAIDQIDDNGELEWDLYEFRQNRTEEDQAEWEDFREREWEFFNEHPELGRPPTIPPDLPDDFLNRERQFFECHPELGPPPYLQ